MRCRNCNNEVNEKDKNCPYCNAPLHEDNKENKNDEPTLGRGMVTFIIFRYDLPCSFRLLLYSQHKNDPEYTQTAIEP